MPERARKAGKPCKRNQASSTERGYDSEWRRFREAYIADKPYCNACGMPAIKPHVDHIIPLRQRIDLKFSESNLQILCPSCHSIKTQKYDR